MNRFASDRHKLENATKLPSLQITPVILCGGAGSRLWPMSRDEKPKQFHPLFNEKSLLANTVSRTPMGVFGNIYFAPNVILGSQSLVKVFQSEVLTFDTPTSKIYLEPSVRDTAAAIASITAAMAEDDPDKLLLVLPSDARIDDHAAFRSTIQTAAQTALATDAIMTIGVAPTRPETQYGYIERGPALGEGYEVTKFREKPNLETAYEYVKSGRFLWNAGMFLYRAGRMADEFSRLQPEIWKHAQGAVKNAQDDGVMVRLDPESFNAAPKLSIDYAIMEKAGNIGVIPADFDWDDLGSWSQLYDAAEKDLMGNAPNGDAILVDARNNYIRSSGPLVALAGVNGLTVVAEDNKVLVLPTELAHLTRDVTKKFKDEFCDPLARAKGSKTAVKRWLFKHALPFWAANGIDFKHGGVHEELNFDGSVATLPSKRLRVTARQIYCFAHASILGWQAPVDIKGSDEILRHCLDTLVETGWHESGGFIHLFNPDGSVQDATRDTYDQCFVLLAMAWLHRAKNWSEARLWADKTLAFMDDHLADRKNGGYFENSNKPINRRANPHMHFLEAMLAWYEATGEGTFLDRAQTVIELFEKHFYNGEAGTVTERFRVDWSFDPHADSAVEPGHHYEWAWLLMRFNALRPTKGLVQKAKTLYATAHAFGHHNKTGAAALTMAVDGSSLSENARCWSQTEALKAAIVFEKSGLEAGKKMRAEMIDLLFKRYLDGPIEGGWYDAIDPDGKPIAPTMPSSTFYHIFCALVEHLEN